MQSTSAAQRLGVLVCLAAGLAACGSSSKSTTAGPPASASTSPTAPASASGTACQRVLKDLAEAPSVLATTAANTKNASSKINDFVDRLRQDAQGATGPLKSDLQGLADKIQSAAHQPSNIDVGALTRQARTVAGDCSPGATPSSIVS